MDTLLRADELLLATRSPMVIASDSELREVSPELWERAGPLMMQAMLGGQRAVLPDQLFCVSRNGYADETYLTICCDPVIDEGHVSEGVIITLTETTERVIGARRTAALRDVAAAGAGARSVDDACRRALEAVSRHPSDVPFALMYVVDGDRAAARLVATAALPARTPASPEIVHLGAQREETTWPLADALGTNGTVVVDDLLTRFGSLPAGDWPFAPTSAVVSAITLPGRDRPDGVLITGVSARRCLDDSYLSFIDLVTKYVAAAIAGGRLHEDEERHAAARAAAALAGAKRRARVRAMKERFAGVLEERTRLAREIHDTLLQGVTGISLNLQAVLPHVRTAPAAALETLERITEMAVRTSREARLAVWDIRPQAMKERELMRAVESAARLALGESSLTLRVSSEGRARRVPADAQAALLRVVQEAVANAARHAEARTVRVMLAFRGPRLRVKVADDGRGFVVKRNFRSYAGHWGLVGMKERAMQIGASLSVRSAPGRGTVVSLDVPIATSRRRGQAA